jgi:hypothetical protein
MLSMTSISTGPFVGSSFSPSCSCPAIRSNGPSVSLAATPDDVLVSRMAGGRFGNLRQRAIGRLDLVIIPGTIRATDMGMNRSYVSKSRHRAERALSAVCFRWEISYRSAYSDWRVPGDQRSGRCSLHQDF